MLLGPNEVHEQVIMSTHMAYWVRSPDGASLMRIKQETGLRLSAFNAVPDKPECQVLHMVGTKEAVQRAQEAVNKAISDAGTTAELLIPAHRCGLIIGPSGETIKGFKEKYNLKYIRLEKEERPGKNGKILHMFGSVENTAEAKKQISAWLDNYDEKRLQKEMVIPLNTCAIVCTHIKEIKQQFDVEVYLEAAQREGVNGIILRLHGRNDAILMEVMQKIESEYLNHTRVQEMMAIPSALCEKFSLPFKSAHSVMMSFVDSKEKAGEKILHMFGKRQNVKRAKRSITSYLLDGTTEELALPCGMTGWVLGVKWENVKKLIVEHYLVDVRIKGQDVGKEGQMERNLVDLQIGQPLDVGKEEKDQVLYITGGRDNVASAKRAIEELLRDGFPVSDCMAVPEKMVAWLHDKSGEQLKKLKVDFDLANAYIIMDQKPQVLRMSGRADYVRKAREHFERMTNEWRVQESQEVLEELVAPAHINGILVERGGEILKQVQQYSGAKRVFSMPKDFSAPREGDQQLRITGSMESVNKAKELLQTFVGARIQTVEERIPIRDDMVHKIALGYSTSIKNEARVDVLLKQASPNVLLYLKGSEANISHARKMLDEMFVKEGHKPPIPLKRCMAIVKHPVQLPRDSFSMLVAHYGDKLRKLIEDSGATLEFDTESILSQSNIVSATVSGNEEQCSKVFTYLGYLIMQSSPAEGQVSPAPYDPACSTSQNSPSSLATSINPSSRSDMGSGRENGLNASNADSSIKQMPCSSSSTASTHSSPLITALAGAQQASPQQPGQSPMQRVDDSSAIPQHKTARRAMEHLQSSATEEIGNVTIDPHRFTFNIPVQSGAAIGHATSGRSNEKELVQKAVGDGLRQVVTRKRGTAKKTVGGSYGAKRRNVNQEHIEIITIDD